MPDGLRHGVLHALHHILVQLPGQPVFLPGAHHVEPFAPQHMDQLILPRFPDLQQLLTYTDDVDLNSKLEAWESFYNYDRPHMSHDGKTPYEVMKSLLDK